MTSRTTACPSCGAVSEREPYDIGSGPELACASCEWCWGADGQDLRPVPMDALDAAIRDAAFRDAMAETRERICSTTWAWWTCRCWMPGDEMPERGLVPVEVRAATAPDGRRDVLLQLPNGYVVLKPADALRVAGVLVEAAAEVAGGGPVAQPSFTCPACDATSYHPKDVKQGYCARCHSWTGERS